MHTNTFSAISLYHVCIMGNTADLFSSFVGFFVNVSKKNTFLNYDMMLPFLIETHAVPDSFQVYGNYLLFFLIVFSDLVF